MSKTHYEVAVKCGNCYMEMELLLLLGERIIDTPCPNCEVIGKLFCLISARNMNLEKIDLASKIRGNKCTKK